MSLWGNYSNFSEVFQEDQHFIPKTEKEMCHATGWQTKQLYCCKIFWFVFQEDSLLMNLRDANRNVSGLAISSPCRPRASFHLECMVLTGIFRASFLTTFVLLNITLVMLLSILSWSFFQGITTSCSRALWCTVSPLDVSNSGLNLSTNVNLKPSCT